MASEEKTEAATHKKRQDERKKGNVFQSNDIVNASSVLILFVVLRITMPGIYEYFINNIREFINYCGSVDSLSYTFALKIFAIIITGIATVAGPIMVIAIIVGVVASGAQTRFIFAFEPLKPKLSKISPLQGIRKMFSMKTFVELLKSLLKATLIVAVFYSEFNGIFQSSVNLMYKDLGNALVEILTSIFNICIKLCMVFVAIAVFDYFYQWWDHEKKIKMTKQEVKEEYKHTEGDPQIKSRIKEAQRKMSQRRMMQDVQTADVVVRNPTHFAVALKYDIDKNGAPVVVGKGQDYLAFKIIEVAAANDIPMIENRPLARELYAKVPIGREIPSDYYTAMAEILAWVYSLKKKKGVK